MNIKKYQDNFVTSRDKIKKDPAEVGKAVHKIMSQSPIMLTVEEILDQYQHDFVRQMQTAVKDNSDKFKAPFYIVVLTKKEHWSEIVLRNWFISRQTKPTPDFLRSEFPNHAHTVYSYDKRKDEIKLLWNLPTAQDALTILKNRHMYDPALVKWIQDYNSGLLSGDSE
jgi:hypothetical protein